MKIDLKHKQKERKLDILKMCMKYFIAFDFIAF